jgi:hypothetical protein
VTNATIRARQPELDNPNLAKAGANRPPSTTVAAVAAVRRAHEGIDRALEVVDPTASASASMSRRPHGDGDQRPFVPDDGIGFVGHATTD